MSFKIKNVRKTTGYGKLWTDDGSIYIGQFKKGKPSEGIMYKLLKDYTHSEFHVKYDEKEKEIEKKHIGTKINII
jgi:hypothetical protein